MGADEFSSALTTLEGLLAGLVADAAPVQAAFRALSDNRPEHLTADQLTRMFAVCYEANGLGPNSIRNDIPEEARRRLGWSCKTLIEATFADVHGEVRSWRATSDNHHIAFNRSDRDRVYPAPRPMPHTPVDLETARELARPYLLALEVQMAKAPFVHLPLCWEVADYPIAPFDVIFDDWIKDMDQRGLGSGNTFEALRRARAWSGLTKRGKQRVSRKGMDVDVMPQLRDPHPMVAASAAQFVGRVYSEPDDFFNHGEPEPLEDVLSMIAELPANRRAVAGGFLAGLDADLSNPFTQMKKDLRLTDFDVDEWVMQVFSDGSAEPYIPGLQAFWFPVHEYYCFDPAFVSRMIDAGLLWEAMMCATEVHDAVEGMQPVLERLAGLKDQQVAGAAAHWLRSFYTST